MLCLAFEFLLQYFASSSCIACSVPVQFLSLFLIQVALPHGESCAAWVAVHAIDFFNDLTTIWAVGKENPIMKYREITQSLTLLLFTVIF